MAVPRSRTTATAPPGSLPRRACWRRRAASRLPAARRPAPAASEVATCRALEALSSCRRRRAPALGRDPGLQDQAALRRVRSRRRLLGSASTAGCCSSRPPVPAPAQRRSPVTILPRRRPTRSPRCAARRSRRWTRCRGASFSLRVWIHTSRPCWRRRTTGSSWSSYWRTAASSAWRLPAWSCAWRRRGTSTAGRRTSGRCARRKTRATPPGRGARRPSRRSARTPWRRDPSRLPRARSRRSRRRTSTRWRQRCARSGAAARCLRVPRMLAQPRRQRAR
mmetsp:Transcript_84681/g.218269  ORF Transcript_84681/g.218269 Transcript_84681/m.218269 type:complete len:279 (+) Transcript_84681:1521-2357(+)